MPELGLTTAYMGMIYNTLAQLESIMYSLYIKCERN